MLTEEQLHTVAYIIDDMATNPDFNMSFLLDIKKMAETSTDLYHYLVEWMKSTTPEDKSRWQMKMSSYYFLFGKNGLMK